MSNYRKTADSLKNPHAEFTVLNSIIKEPKMVFAATGLTDKHFFDESNAALYWAINQLVSSGADMSIKPIDVINVLQSDEAKANNIKELYLGDVQEVFEAALYTPDSTKEAFLIAKRNVQSYALRRNTLNALRKMENACFNDDVDNILNAVYDEIEHVSRDFAIVKDVKEFKYKVKDLRSRLEKRQRGEIQSISMQIPELDHYVQLEEGELVLIGAEQKVGKSAFLLSACVHLLKQGKRILLIDSELSDELFYMRMVAHLSGVEFQKVKSGNLTDEEKARVERANCEIESFSFYHEYLPTFDSTEIMMLTKRCNAINKLDVLVIDYFKNSTDGGAFEVSQAMGRTVDMIKNNICGDLGIPGLGAVQMNPDGTVALSRNIARNTSSLVTLERKKPSEIYQQGKSCGNTKMRVVFNRNGEQHNPDEWIDIQYDGNTLNYHQAEKQHVNENERDPDELF